VSSLGPHGRWAGPATMFIILATVCRKNYACSSHEGKKRRKMFVLGVLLVVHGGGDGWWSRGEV